MTNGRSAGGEFGKSGIGWNGCADSSPAFA
nr:MAG TPA: hypothetical protein [Caudoviricetes sp.]